MTSGLTRVGIAMVGLASLAALHFPASAKPLLSEICVKLAGEHAELLKGGVEASMEYDPEKAREILKPEELANIERFLYIEGQIRFRCPEIKLPGIKDPDLSTSKEAKTKEAKPEPPKQPKGPPALLPKRKPALVKKKPG